MGGKSPEQRTIDLLVAAEATSWDQRDDDSDAGLPTMGWACGQLISAWLEKNGRMLPTESRYLAMGAGHGKPEFALAKELKIPRRNITLLDKGYTHPQYTPNPFRPVQLVPEGAFNFLSKPQSVRYTIVSAFGMEYVFNNPDAIRTLIETLPTVLNPGAIVAVNPYIGRNVDRIWEMNGFTDLFPEFPRHQEGDLGDYLVTYK